MDANGRAEWYDDYVEENDELQVDEYDITVSPNDFNVMTLCSFVESGSVRIPGFQRNFVWDIWRASRLIESLILGLPVPQLFLYEQKRNRFLVIDGQQRLMSIYYFVKKRFPRKDRRADIRRIFDERGAIPEQILHDDSYFESFDLRFTGSLPDRPNKLKGMDYDSLGHYRPQFDLRPIRNIVVKQSAPSGDDSSMFEVFNRLNTGGINLRPQEIRTSMYHSDFYDMLSRINAERSEWRRLLRAEAPDLHMKDVEILLRGFAMLSEGDRYTPSMVRFLNSFSKKCMSNDRAVNDRFENLFDSFLRAASDLPEGIFINQNNRFNIALYEAVFAVSGRKAIEEDRLLEGVLDADRIRDLAQDTHFSQAASVATTSTANVQERLRRAAAIIGSL